VYLGGHHGHRIMFKARLHYVANEIMHHYSRCYRIRCYLFTLDRTIAVGIGLHDKVYDCLNFLLHRLRDGLLNHIVMDEIVKLLDHIRHINQVPSKIKLR
jgi:hypothetical protein